MSLVEDAGVLKFNHFGNHILVPIIKLAPLALIIKSSDFHLEFVKLLY